MNKKITEKKNVFLTLIISALVATGVALPLSAKALAETEEQTNIITEASSDSVEKIDVQENVTRSVSDLEIFVAASLVCIGVFAGIGGKIRQVK